MMNNYESQENDYEEDETDEDGNEDEDMMDYFVSIWEPPEATPRPFAEMVRDYYERDATDLDYIKLFASALRGDFECGDISSWVYQVYIASKVRDNTLIERNRLKAEMENKLIKIKEDFNSKVESEMELRGIYQLIREKFLSDSNFVSYALSKIQQDVKSSKDAGTYPFLYEITLEKCDQSMLVKFLTEEYKEELIEKYRRELKDELLEKYHKEVICIIKEELMKDMDLALKIKEEIKKEVVKSMFD